MSEYTVVSPVGGLRNKVYVSGDIVNDSSFSRGDAEKLVISGHLKPVEQVEPPAPSPASKVETATETKETPTEAPVEEPQPEAESETESEPEADEKKLYDDISGPELKTILNGKVDFKPTASKRTLYDLYLDL